MTDNQSYVNSPIRVRMRVYKRRQLIVEETLLFEGDIDAMIQSTVDRHSHLLIEDGDFAPHMIEFEWLDEADPQQRFRRYGTDPSMMRHSKPIGFISAREMQREMPPLKPGHPAVGMLCSLCEHPFVAGDITMLLPTEVPQSGEHVVECALCHARCLRTAIQEMERQWPTHCEQCGVLLKGGATKHRRGCPWLDIIEGAFPQPKTTTIQ